MPKSSVLDKLSTLENEIMQEINSNGIKGAKEAKEVDKILERLSEMQTNIGLLRDGKLEYCEKCKEFYNSKSFFTESETRNERICIYEDPINSGGNEYDNGQVEYRYRVCPKNHRSLMDRQWV